MQNLADDIVQMHEHPLAVSNAACNIRANIIAIHRSMDGIVLAKEVGEITTASATVDRYEQAVYKSFELVSQRFLGDKNDVKAAEQAFSEWKAIRDEVIRLMELDKKDKAAEIIKGKNAKQVDELDEKIQVLIDFSSDKVDSFFEKAQQNSQWAISVLIFLLVATFITSVIVAIVIILSIVTPLNQIVEKIRNVVTGDLNQEIEISRNDEIGDLAQSICTIVDTLANVVVQINTIANGDYKANIAPRSEKDKLGIALQKMTKTLRDASEIAEYVAIGDYSRKVEVKGDNDLLAKSMNSMIVTLADIVSQVDLISHGDYTADITPRSEKDSMGIALQRMTKTLSDASDVADLVALGDYSHKVEVKGDNDLLAKSINRMVATLADIVKQADVISLGDYTADINQRSEKDSMGIILQRMTKTLRDASDIAEGVAIGDYSRKVEVKGDNDLLAKSMNSMIVTLTDIVSQVDLISQGDYTAEISPRSEKDSMGIALQRMTKTLADIVSQADLISQGDYTAEISPRSEKDSMGIALQRMTKTLRDISAENQRQNWLKTGQTELNKAMRGDLDVIALVRKVITYVAKYLEVQVGTLYLYDEEKQELRLKASYAFNHRKGLNNVFKVGNGLVGQAALELEIISVTDVPEDYIYITSGTGYATPHNIIVAPIVYENVLKAVIELGSLKPFSDNTQQFLATVTENIAISITSAQSRAKMSALLAKSQQQAEELAAQQEELRATNEELEERTQALENNEIELKSQQAELKNSNLVLEKQAKTLQMNEASLRQQKEDLQQANSQLDQTRQEIETKARELEISSRYKSEFLANMSHELRTPLNSMLILSQQLADNEEENLTDDQIESSQIIYNGGQDLLNLINEILDLSKIEAGKMTIDIQTVPLAEITSILNTNFKPLADKKDLALHINIAPDLPTSIETDEQKLAQILKNLLSNAFKFTKKGSITLDFQPVDAKADLSRSGLDPHQAIAIAVIDTGIGIPKEKQLKIFEAFQQADGTTSRQYGGTGLGLSISRELAKLLGGELQLSSVENEGATFTLYLPLDAAKSNQRNRVSSRNSVSETDEERNRVSSRNSVSQKRVPILLPSQEVDAPPLPSIDDDRNNIEENDRILLVIEDDIGFATILYRFAHKKGFKCVHSTDGKTGLEFADKYHPDAIILDIALPQIDGWHVLNRLKDNIKLRHIPVHVMSAQDYPPGVLSRGAIDFLTKPVNEEQLDSAFNKITSLLNKAVKKVLVVATETSVQKEIKEILGNNDIEATIVDTGQAAIQQLKDNAYDCMVLDLILPDESGFTVLKSLEEDDVSIPPVIAYTGRELTILEYEELQVHTQSVVIRKADTNERLVDEVSLFLHRVVKNLPPKKQEIIARFHDKEVIFKDKKILIVDDDMRNLFALAGVLNKNGLNVYKAADGQKALDSLNNEPSIDLVLMDIMMPVMDGYETMRAIRVQVRFKHLPIIALTAKAMKEDRAKCIAAGADDYLTKPVEVNQLLSLMRVWLYK
jgi:signal transduction histidine kinase/CheY-like chemotaxis protein/methyl-accepting chemotaxis protein